MAMMVGWVPSQTGQKVKIWYRMVTLEGRAASPAAVYKCTWHIHDLGLILTHSPASRVPPDSSVFVKNWNRRSNSIVSPFGIQAFSIWIRNWSWSFAFWRVMRTPSDPRKWWTSPPLGIISSSPSCFTPTPPSKPSTFNITSARLWTYSCIVRIKHPPPSTAYFRFEDKCKKKITNGQNKNQQSSTHMKE